MSIYIRSFVSEDWDLLAFGGKGLRLRSIIVTGGILDKIRLCLTLSDARIYGEILSIETKSWVFKFKNIK